jgi:hypothetical protein
MIAVDDKPAEPTSLSDLSSGCVVVTIRKMKVS